MIDEVTFQKKDLAQIRAFGAIGQNVKIIDCLSDSDNVRVCAAVDVQGLVYYNILEPNFNTQAYNRWLDELRNQVGRE